MISDTQCLNGYPASSQSASQPPVSTTYDNIGRLTRLTDQAGTQTQFSYDHRGLVTQRTDAFGLNTNISYDKLGRVISQTDRNASISSASYTASGKLKTLSYPAHSVSFAYNNRDNLISMTDPLGISHNSYDAVNRLTSHTDANGFNIGYQYDSAGNLTQITYPDNKTVSYSYDALNRINNISIDWLAQNATPSYDAAGRLTAINHFNASNTNYNYDKANRLTAISHSNNSQTIASYQYTLDGNGNRIQIIIEHEPLAPAALINKTDTQNYNAHKNRLTSATLSNTPVSFSYDNEGQQQAKASTNYTFFVFVTD